MDEIPWPHVWTRDTIISDISVSNVFNDFTNNTVLYNGEQFIIMLVKDRADSTYHNPENKHALLFHVNPTEVRPDIDHQYRLRCSLDYE